MHNHFEAHSVCPWRCQDDAAGASSPAWVLCLCLPPRLPSVGGQRAADDRRGGCRIPENVHRMGAKARGRRSSTDHPQHQTGEGRPGSVLPISRFSWTNASDDPERPDPVLDSSGSSNSWAPPSARRGAPVKAKAIEFPGGTRSVTLLPDAERPVVRHSRRFEHCHGRPP